MQKQAAEVRGLALQPATVVSTLPAADAGALRAIFGESAKISADANRGFRVEIERIDYASWWDKLDDALSRYPLRIVSLSLARESPDSRSVSVDFILADRARANAGGTGRP
jgi:hypothetical protein